MHLVRSLLPLFLEGRGYAVVAGDAARGDLRDLDLVVERDGTRFGCFVYESPVTAADAVEVRLRALANGLRPILIPLAGVEEEATTWMERFAFDRVEARDFFAFEATIEAEEAQLAAARIEALERATPIPAIAAEALGIEAPAVILPPNPEAVTEIPLGAVASLSETIVPSDSLLEFPSFATLPEPVAAVEAIAPAAEGAESAPPTLALVVTAPVPVPAIVPEASIPDVVPFASVDSLAVPLTVVAETPLAIRATPVLLADPYNLLGMWIGRVFDRVLAAEEESAFTLACEALAALPNPVWVPPAPRPAQAPVFDPAAVLMGIHWPHTGFARSPGSVASLVFDAAPDAFTAIHWPHARFDVHVDFDPDADAFGAFPWPEAIFASPEDNLTTSGPTPEGIHLAVETGLPWTTQASKIEVPADPVISAGLPWDPAMPRETTEEMPTLAGRAFEQRGTASVAAEALAIADPRVWGLRDRLEGVRRNLNIANANLALANVDSDWLRGLTDQGSDIA
ncbi:MAG: hypothetical protein ACYDDF_13350 [Thermoplasmatota archaeon]